jgi:ribose 5-phosphate isomerase B
MKVLIASDHAGFELKQSLIEHAEKIGVTFSDLGTHSTESVDYPDFADHLCQKLIQLGPNSHLGILICGSGVGVSIAANRYREVRAVLAETPEIATLGREHNHANVLCLGARFLDTEHALTIIKAFLTATPDLGERHSRRVQKLSGTKS